MIMPINCYQMRFVVLFISFCFIRSYCEIYTLDLQVPSTNKHVFRFNSWMMGEYEFKPTGLLRFRYIQSFFPQNGFEQLSGGSIGFNFKKYSNRFGLQLGLNGRIGDGLYSQWIKADYSCLFFNRLFVYPQFVLVRDNYDISIRPLGGVSFKITEKFGLGCEYSHRAQDYSKSKVLNLGTYYNSYPFKTALFLQGDMPLVYLRDITVCISFQISLDSKNDS